MASEQRVVRVVPDVAGIEAEFDYLVPPSMESSIGIGTIVRVQLQRRRVRAWVVADHVEPPPGVGLKEVLKVSGVGPPPEIIDLASWAAWRWAGKRAFFLQTASPPRNVRSLLQPSTRARKTDASEHFVEPLAVLRWPPASDPLPLAMAADAVGPALILTPSRKSAERLVARMRALGSSVVLHPEGWTEAASGGRTVVGTRAAAWSPLPDLNAVLVIDAHDQGFQSESSPTWNAVDVAVERARRRDVPCVLATPVPRVELLSGRALRTPSRDEERSGWAALQVVDLRKTDPRKGLYSEALVRLLRTDKRLICILNRKGRAQLLVCSACDEIARCEQCAGAVALDDEALVCKRCHHDQAIVCASCGSSRFKQLRPGVSKVREELEALAQRPVGEVSSDSDELSDASVLIGTEAVLHRVGKADAVVFVDFDQELLANRYSAAEDALVLLARASRLVGGRRRGGIVVVQTRQPDHETIDAGLHADPSRLTSAEALRRDELLWPPARALALASGPGAADYVNRLPESVEVLGPSEGKWLLRAKDWTELGDALAATTRPKEAIRVEVGPARV